MLTYLMTLAECDRCDTMLRLVQSDNGEATGECPVCKKRWHILGKRPVLQAKIYSQSGIKVKEIPSMATNEC